MVGVEIKQEFFSFSKHLPAQTEPSILNYVHIDGFGVFVCVLIAGWPSIEGMAPSIDALLAM